MIPRPEVRRPAADLDRRLRLAARIKLKHMRRPEMLAPDKVIVSPLCNGVDRVTVTYTDGTIGLFDVVAPYFQDEVAA